MTDNFQPLLGESLSLFEKTFPKEWVNKLENDYHSSITEKYDIQNKTWFANEETRFGHYGGRNDKFIKKEISDYFNRLLYGSNIFALDFLLRCDKKIVSQLNFCDAGSGFGLLSCFLQKAGVVKDCYNYENFSQLGNMEADQKNNDFYEKYKIMPPSSVYPNPKNVDILYCADITTGMSHIFAAKPKLLMLEHFYTSPYNSYEFQPVFEFHPEQLTKAGYRVLCDYYPMMAVWVRT